MEAQLNYSHCVHMNVRTNTCIRWIQRHSNPSIFTPYVWTLRTFHTHMHIATHTHTRILTNVFTSNARTHAHHCTNGVFVVAFLKCFFGRFVRKIIVKTAQNPKLSLALSLTVIEISRISTVNRITSVYGWQRMDFFPYSCILYIHHIWFWDRSVCSTEYFPRKKRNIRTTFKCFSFFTFYSF